MYKAKILNMNHVFCTLFVAFFFLVCTLSQSSPPVPVASNLQANDNGAICLQTRASSDPDGSTIFAALARDNIVNKACDPSSAIVDTASSTSYYIANGDYTFNSSFEASPSGLPSASCEVLFNTILSTCVEHGKFWGGWVAEGASNYSGNKENY